MLKNKRGITLIALIITIIVLLILAGVTVPMLIDNNGVVNKSITAKKSTQYADEEEKIQEAYIISATQKNKDEQFARFEKEIENKFASDARVQINEDGTYTVIMLNGNEHTVGEQINDAPTVKETILSNYDVKVYGYNLDLTGRVSFNIYFQIPEEKFKDGESIRIENPSREENSVLDIDVKKENFKIKTIEGNSYYALRYDLIAKEMADEIKIRAYDGESYDSEEYSTSIKNIGEEIIDKKSCTLELKNYIKALLNYGGYTQEFLNYNTSNLANSGTGIKIEITDSDIEEFRQELEQYEPNLVYNELENTESSINDSVERLRIFKSVLYENYPVFKISFMTNKKDETYRLFFDGKEMKMTETVLGDGIRKTSNMDNMIEIPLEDFYKAFELKIVNSSGEEVLTGTIYFVETYKSIINMADQSKLRKQTFCSGLMLQKAYMELIK